jgi:hypothetical protein
MVPRWERAELMRRQVCAGQTMEDMELILSPQVEDAKEAIGSMGDDAPLAVISDKPRLISHFFRQNFSQVTNPPIDSLRETRVMSLKTRFGNLANILDTEAQQSGVLVLDSPVLHSRDWHTLRDLFRGAGGRDRLHLRRRRRPRRAAFGDRPGAARGRDRGARRQDRAVPDRRACRSAAGRDRDGARRRRRPHPSRPPRAALLCVGQRALGRMPRRALLCGADRGRRDDGEPLSGRGGDRRSPRRGLFGDISIARRSSASARRSTTACSRSCPRWGSR